MPVVTRYPSSDTSVSGTWTNPTNVQADDNAVAAVTIAAKNTTFERQQGNYDFDSEIPAGSTINSVALEVEHRVTTTAGIAFLESLAYISSTGGAVNSNDAEPTTLTAESFANYARPGGGSWTRADLLNGTFSTGIRGRSGNSATSFTCEWDYIRVVVDYTEADTTPPTVGTFEPANAATGVLTGANIVITFDEAIQRGTGTITLREGSASGTIIESFDAAASGRLSISGSALTIDPTNLLPTSTEVFVVIPSGAITDTSSNAYAGTSTYSFTTEAAPVVNTFNPASGATNVFTDSNLVLSFSKTIARGTGTITLRSGSASGTILESFTAASSGRLTLSGSTFTVDPTALLPTGTQVFLVIPSGAITDTSGNSYAGTSTYSFTTQAAPAVSTFNPASGATGVLTGANAVLTFDRAMARGTGTITIRSGSAAGTILESLNAASSNRITISGSTVTIDPTALLPTGTQVFVVIPSGALLDTIGNPYAGTSTYSFTTEAAPVVNTFSPTVGATGVALDANLVLTFNKSVARGTGTITLRKADNTTVETFSAASSDRISISGSTYTVNPTADFEQNVVYYLDIPSSAITDTSGNAYAGTTSYTWTSVFLGVLFPTSPSEGDTYTFAGRKWRFDGTGWERPLVSKLGDTVEGPLLATTTDAWRLPVGTTGQRPAAPLSGMVRFNSTASQLELYDGSGWASAAPALDKAQAYNTATVSGVTTAAAISFGAESFDTASMWAVSPNPTRIVIPAAGVYSITFSGLVTFTADTYILTFSLRKNGTEIRQFVFRENWRWLSDDTFTVQINEAASLAANDYLEIFHSGDSTGYSIGTGASARAQFTVIRAS